MKFSRPLWWLCSSLNKAENGQSANAVDHPANASAPEPAVTSRISEFPTYNVSQRPDEGDISGGNVIEFCRSASFGLCPERGMKSWEGGSALSNHETSYNQGQQRNCSASAPRDSADGGEAATADKGLLSSLLIHHKGAIKELEGQGKKGSHSGASLPRPLKKVGAYTVASTVSCHRVDLVWLLRASKYCWCVDEFPGDFEHVIPPVSCPRRMICTSNALQGTKRVFPCQVALHGLEIFPSLKHFLEQPRVSRGTMGRVITNIFC